MKKIEFVKPVYNLNELPKQELPTVVLCGRSNVGKSSFINSLFNSKIAKTSSSPGKTRSINYYLVENKFYIVDLPGYGYAKVSKSERDAWHRLMDKYFAGNRFIILAIHLIDSRHDPTPLDIELHDYLNIKGITTFVMLNKSDKLKQSEQAVMRKKVSQFFPELIYGENLLFYSAYKGTGKKEVIKLVLDMFIA